MISPVAGSLVTLTVTIKDPAGQLIDPTTLKVVYRVRSRPPVSFTYGVDAALIRDGVGLYHVDVDSTDQAGPWTAEVITTGVGQGADDTAFKVMELPITP